MTKDVYYNDGKKVTSKKELATLLGSSEVLAPSNDKQLEQMLHNITHNMKRFHLDPKKADGTFNAHEVEAVAKKIGFNKTGEEAFVPAGEDGMLVNPKFVEAVASYHAVHKSEYQFKFPAVNVVDALFERLSESNKAIHANIMARGGFRLAHSTTHVSEK